jgi:hypothetical protein
VLPLCSQQESHPDSSSQPGDVHELSRVDKVIPGAETEELSVTDTSRPNGDIAPTISRQLTWGDAVEESLKETENSENVVDDVRSSKVFARKPQENVHVKSKDEMSWGKFKQDKQGYRKPDSESVRDKASTGTKASYETGQTNDRSQVDDKPALQRVRSEDKMFVSNKSNQEAVRSDDRPPAKKMKDESNTFYNRKDDGYNRDRSERNRSMGRNRGKADNNRGAVGRTGYGGSNISRQGPARDGMADYGAASMGEKRGTLTFERSDLYRENDARKGNMQRTGDLNRKDSAPRRKEDVSVTSNKPKDETDQQSNKESQAQNPQVVAAAVPRTNAWDQPLRLPKSSKPERGESIEKQNNDPMPTIADQPVESADTNAIKSTKQDTGASSREGNLSHSDKDIYHHDIRREYRTGRGRRTARRAQGRRHNWTSESAALVDDESYSQRKRQDQDNSQQFDEGGNQLDDTTYRGDRNHGNRRRPRTGPSSNGRNIQRSLRENISFEASAGKILEVLPNFY